MDPEGSIWADDLPLTAVRGQVAVTTRHQLLYSMTLPFFLHQADLMLVDKAVLECKITTNKAGHPKGLSTSVS